MPDSNRRLFFLVYLFLIAVIFVSLELVLRLIDAGYNTDLFIHPKYMQDYYIENSDYLAKYFKNHAHVLSYMEKTLFKTEKDKNTVRGFVLGGSTAQGWPFESNHAFGKIAELLLNRSTNDRRFEIINLGASAMSSYYIKDVAMKLLRYRPDFIVIYGGHNEYYGTISASTGRIGLFKKMYLSLKEIRIFQLIFLFLDSIGSKPQEGKKSLFSKQYNNIEFPADDRFDRDVAETFIRNIRDVVRVYSARKIPVILFQPVCNLYDMPPFAGANDSQFKQKIIDFAKAVSNPSSPQTGKFRKELFSSPGAGSNANILYLDAKYRLASASGPALPLFINAKDMDTIPFRARTALVDQCDLFAKEEAARQGNLEYIPTLQILTNAFGEKVMGNEIFIDHLHFNRTGQILIGTILAKTMASLFHVELNEKSLSAIDQESVLSVDRENHYLPLYDLMANNRIKWIVADVPYNKMLVPYLPDRSYIQYNEIMKDTELSNAFTAGGQSLLNEDYKLYAFLLSYYNKTKDINRFYSYLNSLVYLYPGSFWPYRFLGKFYAINSPDTNTAIEYYRKAYLLSGKNKDVLDEFEYYFYKSAQKFK